MQAVTIISDFGTQDHYSALLKGSILKLNQNLNLIDVTHHVDTHDIRQAAYHLRTLIKYYPAQTIHVVAVYNIYQSEFEMICFEYRDQYFIGPNNGIFSLAFDTVNEDQIYKINYDDIDKNLFNLIAHGVNLLSQNMTITEVGPPLNHYLKRLDIQPVVTDDEIRATIIHIDKYENIILNVSRVHFEYLRRERNFEIYFKYYNPIKAISNTYSDVPIGEVLCLFNASEYLEIAIHLGKAATQLDLAKEGTIQIKFL